MKTDTNGWLGIKMVVHTSCCTHMRAHTRTFTHPLADSHTFTHACSANTEMATFPLLPLPPTVGTVPHLICNSKFQKEHLLKKEITRNAEIWLDL